MGNPGVVTRIEAAPDEQPEQGLLPKNRITEICSWREAALREAARGANLLAEGYKATEYAVQIAENASGGMPFWVENTQVKANYEALFARSCGFDAEASLAAYQQHLDGAIWRHLLAASGMAHMMDRTAKEEFEESLKTSVPEATEDNIRATFSKLMGDAELIFQRGLARAFIELDRRFKSHDGFKIGSRIILTHIFDSWGAFTYGSKRDTLVDVQRVFAVLDGQRAPDVAEAAAALADDRRGGGLSPRQSCTETSYFRIRGFKNGNAHLWFKRDDLVQKANEVLAAYYGQVMPDHVDRSVVDPVRCTALSRDLAFYPTPVEAGQALLSEVYFGENSRVLEPSAGDGALVRQILNWACERGGRWGEPERTDRAASVTAIEVHPERVQTLRSIMDNRLRVAQGNFLAMEPPRDLAAHGYSHVIMNPPFYGTHWMEHVRHALSFLAPGGVLRAILPASAQISESAQHEKFREWARQHTRYNSEHRMFCDLPPESFASVGTRINTVVLTLYKA